MPELTKEAFEKAAVKYDPLQVMENIHSVANGPLWEKAKKKSEEEYGHIKWPFVMWLYEQMGGGK